MITHKIWAEPTQSTIDRLGLVPIPKRLANKLMKARQFQLITQTLIEMFEYGVRSGIENSYYVKPESLNEFGGKL